VLKPRDTGDGHLRVVLGRGNRRQVHRLVLLAFVGPPPAGCETRHLNGDPADNRLDNLEWATHRRNMQDVKWHHGLGPQNLTIAEAQALKRALQMPLRHGDCARLARRYDITVGAVYHIRDGLAHADVGDSL
jgi:hypothetical protein